MAPVKDLAASIAKATWTVEASSLRQVLERLRVALPGALPSAPPGAEPLEYREVARRLRPLFEKLRAIDLSTVQIGFEAAQQARRAPQLLELLEQLHRDLKSHVVRVLGREKIELLFRLLSSPTPDMLSILGRSTDENAHSNLIAWLLDPRRAPRVARHALRKLVTHLPEQPEESWRGLLAEAVATESISVRREVVIAKDFEDASDLSRVDIVISGTRFMIAIENKVRSLEHSDQTCAYWDWMQSMTGLKGGLFLSPSGAEASCPSFVSISYLELVSCLLEGPAIEALSVSEEMVLASYLKTLAREIAQVEMRAVLELSIEKEQA